MHLKKKQLKFSIIQHKIVQATRKQQQRKIRNLQRLLMKSLSTRIQIILIGSKNKKFNEYLFLLKKNDIFFVRDDFRDDFRRGLCPIFFKKKKNTEESYLIKQTEYSNPINSYFIGKFVSIFYLKFFSFCILINKRLKKLKKKRFTFLFMNKQNSQEKQELFSFFSKKNQFTLKNRKNNFKISLEEYNSLLFFFKRKKQQTNLFLFISHLAFYPVIETLLNKKQEKIFRNSSEIIMFLNNFFDKSKKTFNIEKKNSQIKKSTNLRATPFCWIKNSPLEKKQKWILKLEIQGIYEHLNNTWLYSNFPIELFILKNFFFNRELYSINTDYVFFANKKLKQKKFNLRVYNLKKNVKKKKLIQNDFLWENNNDFFIQNFNNFFIFCLIGLEKYLNDILDTLNSFYFSKFLNLSALNKDIYSSKPENTKQIFSFYGSIYFIGLNRRQFKFIKKLINSFLKQRGLSLKKTTYFNLKKGFYFLGWNLTIRKKKEVDMPLMIEISELFYHSQKKEIKWLIKNSKNKSLAKLIIKINKKIKNDLIEYEKQRILFNNLLKNIQTFYSYLNFFLNKIFWKWAKKRHNNRSNIWIFKKYWDLRKKKKRSSGTTYKNFFPTKKNLEYQKMYKKNSCFNLKKMNFKGKKSHQIFKHKKRIYVLLYEKRLNWNSSCYLFNLKKNCLNLNNEFYKLNKNKKNFYFLNFYSLDFETQYSFFLNLFILFLYIKKE